MSNDDSTGDVASRVHAFYESLPFNQHDSAKDAARSIRAHDLESSYPDLHALLASGRTSSVLEIGCGAGWLAATIAHHYGERHGVDVAAIDFCSRALSRARIVAEELHVGDRISFVQSDLFEYERDEPVDLVISLGVLHHTRDCEAAFRHVQRFARDHVYIGLYHAPGRHPFLEMFRAILESDGEDAAFERYRALDGIHAADSTLVRSWFRDQVLHPHETQHTLREVHDWFESCGLRLESTSINRFAKIHDLDAVFALEDGYADRSRQANLVEGRYFPGFFTLLASRPQAPGAR
ncbi:MAG: methyltransferase domain-containing protein [Planctomycetes bacterium]|nr:methyltransferase domain-containing protein [Planctomycetota bacterium]MCB9920007.1 methyltransferase domain-containing protein [Planctomycetota bacterium]